MHDSVGLVSAAEMQNHETRHRHTNAAHLEQTDVATSVSRPAVVVERESWMDAQSVERMRLKEEYERERGHGASALAVEAVSGEPVDEAESPGNGRRQNKQTERSVNGKAKSKSKEKGKKTRRQQSHHTSRDAKNPGVSTRSEGNLQQGVVPTKQPATSVFVMEPEIPSFKSDGLPTAPPEFPWYPNQTPYAEIRLQPPGMPMQNAPWGQQAQQSSTEQHSSAAQSQQGLPVRIPPPLATMFPPVFNNHQTMQFGVPTMAAVPSPGAEEYSPRTMPPGLPFPFTSFGGPIGQGSHEFGMAVGGKTVGMPGGQWPSMFPSSSGLLPDSPIIPGAGPTVANQFTNSKTSTGQNQSHSPHQQRSKNHSPVQSRMAYEETGDPKASLDGLRARMKKNAEESRAALESERSSRKTSEQRIAALDRLVGSSSNKKVGVYATS